LNENNIGFDEMVYTGTNDSKEAEESPEFSLFIISLIHLAESV